MLVSFSSGAHDCAFSLFDKGLPIHLHELERINRVKECSGANFDIVEEFLKTGLEAKAFSSFEMHWNGGLENMWPKSTSKLNRPIVKVPHHTAHAAHAFYSSNFNEALIFSIDGGGTEEGEDSAFCVFKGSDLKLERLERIPISQLNIGYVWTVASMMISPNGVGNQSGTVMAMAAFGEVVEYLVDFFIESFSNEGLANRVKELKENFNNIAASLQEATERVVSLKVKKWAEKTKIDNLCFVGGVALNSSMIGKFVKSHTNIYVPPVPYDSGLALGCSQYLYHSKGGERVAWDDCLSPYLGGAYKKKRERNSSDKEVVELLAQGKIIAVYGGRSECGRRALGNRSILANPMIKDMKDKINERVKHRQSFRPFAPSILNEKVGDYFEQTIFSPYMSFCLPFKKSVRDEIPSVVHKDGTGRLQTVTEKTNPWYHNLLSLFEEKTGCPILLNTSFNDREPIVETQEDAENCFSRTEIDYLYFRETETLIAR